LSVRSSARLLAITGVAVTAAIVAGAGILLHADPQPVSAAPEIPTTSTSVAATTTRPPCLPGTADPCALDLGANLQLASADATVTDNGDGTATVAGTMQIDTGAGAIEIGDADLVVSIPEDGGETEIVSGTGNVPLPTIGFLEKAEMIGESTGLFGVDYGRDIENLGAFVNPDTKYLWISFSNGLHVNTGFGEMFPDMDTSALPSAFDVPLGVTGTMVIDPTDPYIYIGGACPEFGKSNDEEEPDSATTATSSASTTTTTTTEAPDDDAPLTIGPAEPPGEDCGIGFSLQGRIPYSPPAMAELPASVQPYSGHIVIHGEVPLGETGVAIDGVTIQRLDPAGYRLDGYGDVLATVPFLSGLVDLEIPLGDAAAGMEVTGYGSRAYAAGNFGGSQDPLVLPLPIPIEIPNEQSSQAHVTASIGGSVDADGAFHLDPDSELTIAGKQGIGASAFASLLDVELDDFQTTTGTLVLDRNGAFIEATTNFGIHPDVDLGAGTRITASIDAANLTDSYLEMVGLMSFGAVQLDGESQLRVDKTGIRAHGLLRTAIGGIEMEGTIGTDGIDLRGHADLEFPVGISDRLATDADTALTNAIAEVKRLDDEIAAATELIKADRRQRSSEFRAADAALRAAQDKVNEINGQISANDDRIDYLKGKVDGICSGETGLELTGCQLTHATQIAGWEAEITALHAANLTLEGSRAVAVTALDGARTVLRGVQAGLDAIPVDADPRIITLTATRETAAAALETARTLVDVAGNGGSLGGNVDLRIGTSGLGGEARIQWCDDDGCKTLAGAELRLDDGFEACIAVFGIPNVCAEF
jgi:hypothetical protein